MPHDPDIETCLRVLKELRREGAKHAAYAEVEREVSAFYKQGKKQRRLSRKRARNERDRSRIEATGRVTTPLAASSLGSHTSAGNTTGTDTPSSPEEYERSRACYVCKVPYRELDRYYHLLCPSCAAEHHAARERRGDLRGRHALVTGGRVKIGFELVRMLLRDGASVTLVTRFPRDAARRFAALPEAGAFGERLEIVGLDLRYLPRVVGFCESLIASGRALDILVNNAAQTVHRPPAYYRDLAAGERAQTALPSAGWVQGSAIWLAPSGGSDDLLARFYEECLADPERQAFPAGLLTEEALPLDLRERNSWSLNLADVDTREMVEAQLVNSMAPFVLMGRLRPALERSRWEPRFVVNVSAMEGKFDYAAKSSRHPHTNMAKAALNMITRTSAADYARSAILVNSVDTGWITDENPEHLKQRLRAHGFYPPLDAIDGAARIYAPILDGLEGRAYFGQFLKDYRPTSW